MSKYSFKTQGTLVRRPMHKPGAKRELYYVVLYLSDALERKLTFGPGGRLRITGELEGEPVKLALQPSPGENHYVMVSKSLLERTGALLGDKVTLQFNLADPNEVDLPDALDALLKGTARKTWESLTAGKRRTWTTYVDRAKRPETRAAKAREVVDRIRRNLLNPKDPWP